MSKNKKGSQNEDRFKEQISILQKELEKCTKEKDEYLEGWKRSKADFMNYKAEESERSVKEGQKAKEEIIKDVVAVLDSFEMGILSTEGQEMKKSDIEIIRDQLSNTLKRYGVEKMEINEGDEFNPEYHEAIGHVDSDLDSGSIVEVVDIGYTMNKKTFKPAKVRIAK